MPAPRNGRAQRPTRQRQPAAPANGQPTGDYAPVTPGLTACRRCAAVLVDSQAAREQHTAFHQSLRKMWDALGSRS